MNRLQGKKMTLGMILGAVLTLVLGIDSLIHDDATTEALELGWLNAKVYATAAGLIATFTGYAVSDRWNRTVGK